MLLLLAICVISSFNVLFSRADIKSDLEKIDEVLVDRFPLIGLQSDVWNIEALNKLIKIDPLRKQYKETLGKLVSLVDDRCTEDTFNNLKEIHDALYIKTIYEVGPIDRLVKQLGIRHAKLCSSVYPERLNSKKLDKEKVRYVETLADNINKNRGQSVDWKRSDISAQKLFRTFVLDPIGWRSITPVLFKTIENSLGEDLKNLKNETADREKLAESYSKYLVEPCEYYVKELGPQVFMPLELDAEFYHLVDESDRDFYRIWSQYQVCKRLTSRKASQLDNLVEYANDDYWWNH